MTIFDRRARDAITGTESPRERARAALPPLAQNPLLKRPRLGPLVTKEALIEFCCALVNGEVYETIVTRDGDEFLKPAGFKEIQRALELLADMIGARKPSPVSVNVTQNTFEVCDNGRALPEVIEVVADAVPPTAG